MPHRKPLHRPPSHATPTDQDDDGKLQFDNYAEYARTFRTWMVAYGIGAPVLLATNDIVAHRLAHSPLVGDIVHLFLLGVGLQVVLALLNKWSSWHRYAATGEPEKASSLRYRFWDWVGDQSWFDLLVDLTSLIAFGVATTLAVEAFLASASRS